MLISFWKNFCKVFWRRLGRCDGCGSNCKNFGATRRRMNTAYTNEESNFAFVCEDCYKEIYDHYEEMWKDYYGGLL